MQDSGSLQEIKRFLGMGCTLAKLRCICIVGGLLQGRKVEAELLVCLNVQPFFMCRFWICSQRALHGHRRGWAPSVDTACAATPGVGFGRDLAEGFPFWERVIWVLGAGERSVTELMMSLTWRKEDTLVALCLLLKGLVTVCTRLLSGGLWMRSLGSWANRELKELWWDVTKVALLGVPARQMLQSLYRVPSGLRRDSGLLI